MLPDVDILYLCNFDEHNISTDNEIVNKLWSAEWSLVNQDICKEILATGLETEPLLELIKKYTDDEQALEKIRHIAITSFLTFCNQNWSPHPENKDLNEYFGTEWPSNIDIKAKMQRDSEPIYVNILHPELLYFVTQIFTALFSVKQNLLHLWWCFRSKVAHQRALEDTSATLYSELELMMAKLTNELQSLQDKPRLSILLNLEIAQAYLIYGRVQKVEEYLLKARDLAGLKLELTGILGKRTKFQQTALPQLALSSVLDANVDRPSAQESHGDSELPPEVELQDDVRLDKIQYNEEIRTANLPSLEQTLCLLTIQYLQKSQPKDDLTTEELQAYIQAILSQDKGPWSTRAAALLIRCKLEATHKRTVERAMLQCETIVNDKAGVAPTSRLSYLWASGLQPAWTWRQQLADLYLSLGLVKAALEHYLALQLWEDVIVCYTCLQLRHKAAEIIRQQIEIEPTVKLYCLLGDATDDVSCFEKAWEFSNHKSSRAQRHWGNFLFDHKKYEECIPHFEKSVEINSIQEGVWLRLGYAALMTDNWELSAKAYRRYTYLQPNSFEAWNNLAKVYVQQGDKKRAYRALIEALRFNYDNWKLWENVIIVSMDTGHFEDVIRGVHRVLDIQRKFDDVEVLTLLTRAIVQDAKDADGHGAARLRKRVLELFGRITSIHQNKPELWQLYSDISPTYLLKAQRLLKAYKGFTQSGKWNDSPEICQKVIELAQSLLDYSLKARQEVEDKDKLQADQQLSSARLTGQAVIRAVEKQDWPETRDNLEKLKEMFSNVTEYMKSIV
ncbi:tetratricopeptide repeat protein 27 [Pectinophora gossypiella]|uniref:tetratricopeptide repeat protein 27 n=1 Tax=Pectinophora gossypiella TaxID=13191 RepID=UPI00214EE972|nr:tetratricopeptide repeat protein 27 [Pectinophora gossypiella]